MRVHFYLLLDKISFTFQWCYTNIVLSFAFCVTPEGLSPSWITLLTWSHSAFRRYRFTSLEKCLYFSHFPLAFAFLYSLCFFFNCFLMFLFNHGKLIFDLDIFEGTCESITPNNFSLKYVYRVSTFSPDFVCCITLSEIWLQIFLISPQLAFANL